VLKSHHLVNVFRVIGITILIGLAVASILYTANYSRVQNNFLDCSLHAFKIRDDLQVRTNQISLDMDRLRHQTIIGLFRNARNGSDEGELVAIEAAYEKGYEEYTTNLVAIRIQLEQAPLPRPDQPCPT
jgi:hypothetical protein